MIAAQPRLTEQQRNAIATRGVSVALSAGAGCGKTFVLTERFLADLEPEENGVPAADLHELIAITFTDRAVREMRDRIARKCYDRLQRALADGNSKKIEYWLRLLRSLHTARISTIHSFCGSLLRANAVESQLDPQFTVVEQAQADTLKLELVDDVLRERLSDHDEAVIDLAAKCGLAGVRNALVELLNCANEIDFDVWLGRTPDQVVAIWMKFHADVVVPSVLRQVAESDEAIRLLEILRKLDPPPENIRAARAVLLDELPNLPNADNPLEQMTALREAAKMPSTRQKGWDGALYTEFKDAAESFRDRIGKISRLLAFDPAAALPSADAGLKLLSLSKTVAERYAAQTRIGMARL